MLTPFNECQGESTTQELHTLIAYNPQLYTKMYHMEKGLVPMMHFMQL